MAVEERSLSGFRLKKAYSQTRLVAVCRCTRRSLLAIGPLSEITAMRMEVEIRFQFKHQICQSIRKFSQV
jgi:hypothetical protein